MSIHGSQYLLTLFNTPSNIPPINGNDELALAFYLLTKDKKHGEKITSFSRLLWPFLCIQGVISTHIILDGLMLFSRKGKLSNPPRQPLIGHIIRNIENRTKKEQLSKIYEVLTYKDREAEEIGEGEESEFQKLNIESLINPGFLQTLAKLLPFIDYQPITDYIPLDSGLSTDLALNIAEKYRNMIDYMKGNALRWENQIDLIGKEVDKWLIELNVQFKDIEARYSSQITKTSQIINNSQVQEQLDLEGDKIEQWKVNEKKKLIESISVLFKTIEYQLEAPIKKNKMFTRSDTLKSRIFEDVINSFDNHFENLRIEGHKFLETVATLKEKFIEIKKRAPLIDEQAEKRLADLNSQLSSELKARDIHLSEFEIEKQKKISEINTFKEQIEELYSQIKTIIKTKQNNCLQEAKDLISWSLKDNQAEIFSRPIQWIYMPLYAMFIEDNDTMEEKLRIIFPGNVNQDPNNIYNEISEELVMLKNQIYDKIEDDMALRSNFEFSCENKNILEDKNFNKKIQQGISILRNKKIINDDIELAIRSNLNNL
ncbi:MAG: hypothetical protein ACTSV5_12635 [Promethearchaeota archaeon]